MEPAAKRVKVSTKSEAEAKRFAKTYMWKGERPEDSVVNPAQHPAKPVTWPWSLLFAIYVFADKYDTADLRCAAINFIQAKLMMITPVIFDMPTLADTRSAVKHLPSTSPLRRVLVDFWALQIEASYMREHYGDGLASILSEMPSSFLAECLMSCKTFDEATTPDGADQDRNDALRMFSKGNCVYHEHQNESAYVKDCCRDGWNRFSMAFCKVPNEEAEIEQDE